MAPSTDRLLDLATDLLAGVVARWPGDASDLPELQYLTNGAIAWDGCDVLAVSFSRTAAAFEGDPAQEAITSGVFVGVQFGVFDVTLLRCVPDMVQTGNELPTLPSPADLTASAEQLIRDAQALTNAVIAAQKAGDLAGCGGLVVEGCSAQGPEGGMGGNNLRVRLSLI